MASRHLVYEFIYSMSWRRARGSDSGDSFIRYCLPPCTQDSIYMGIVSSGSMSMLKLGGWEMTVISDSFLCIEGAYFFLSTSVNMSHNEA